MTPLRSAAIAIALLTSFTLAGCDNNDKPQEAQSAPASTSTSSTPQDTPKAAKPDSEKIKQLAKSSEGKPLTLVDASEVQLDGAAALVLTFSIPLNPDQNFAQTVHVVDKKNGKVDGAWELAPNLKELRLRHLEPNRELLVSVDRGLQALNNATFSIDYEKPLTTRDIQPTVGFASRGSLLPGKVVEGLPVIALNVEIIDFTFYRVQPD